MPPRVGDTVRVIDGPFEDFTGIVTSIDAGQKVTVTINMFGRITPVQLDLRQVDRL
jgi:transcriptional antiterminator NusG